MPTQPATHSRTHHAAVITQHHSSSFRAKRADAFPLFRSRERVGLGSRGICFFFALCTLAPGLTNAQSGRPKIVGVGRVTITADKSEDHKPGNFYSALNLASFGITCTGDPCFETYAINKEQELVVIASSWPTAKVQDPPRNNLAELLFETSDVRTLHDYLQSRGLSVDEVSSDGRRTLDADGTEVTGNPFIFRMQDPDGHRIGFVQFGMPLRSHAPDTAISTRLLHAGFIVRNRAAMEHFYKDILGFRPYWHGGMKDDQTDWISLQVPDGTDWVELMVNVPENADQHLRGVMNHIALGVPDIQKAREQLVKNGVHLTEQPKLGRDGKWQLNLYDPDQTRIEFMEFTPKEKPCCSEFTGPHPQP